MLWKKLWEHRKIKAIKAKDLEHTVRKNMALFSSIPLIIAILFLFLYVVRATLVDYKRGLTDSAVKCGELINIELEMFLTKSDVLLQNRYLINGLKTDYQGDIESMMSFYENLEILISEPYGDKYRGFFTVYPFNDSIFEGSYVERYERIRNLGIQEKLSSMGDTGVLWWDPLNVRIYLNNAAYIRFYRSIKNFNTPIGILEANIPFENVKRIMDNTVIAREAVLILQSAEGETLYMRRGEDGKEALPENLREQNPMEVTTALMNGYTVTAAIPRTFIMKTVFQFLFLMAWVLIAVVALMIYLARYSSRKTLGRLKNFMDILRRDESLLLNQELIPESGDGEIAVIERRFKDLISRVNHLHKEAAQARQERSQFELELVQARFNPHLLYNSLSAIKWNAQWNKDVKTADLIDHMTRYYRTALNKGNTIIPISEELAMIRDYVRINEFSYCCSYSLTFDMEEGITSLYTFKHLLQPIVENAILHGLNGREEGGAITISGHREGERLELSVRDNGAGIRPEKIQRILSEEPLPSSGGFGMRNLIKRIRLYFGEDCSLKISNLETGGTEVLVSIKAVEEKDVLENHGLISLS